MLKALILGLAISCLLLGIECLAVDHIKLAQADSRIVVIPEIFGWLLIGIGSSTTLYTLINRSSSPASTNVDFYTTADTDDASDSQHQWDTTDYDLTEHYADDEHEEYDTYDEEDYFDTDEEDESNPEFDLEKFNQQFDIDELLEE
ncbi:MAG: hypothetical protein VX761_00285 [Planctomycetota bacterium]|nr:hypothetical protein [Planctomycetota bacterium]